MVTSSKSRTPKAKAGSAANAVEATGGETGGAVEPDAGIIPEEAGVDNSITPEDLSVEPVTEAFEEVESQVTEPAAGPEIAVAETVQTVTAVKQEGMVMVDLMETTKKLAEDTKVRFETAFADLSEKAKVNVEKSSKAMEEISDLAKGNVEALVESGKIAAKGFEGLSQSAADFSRTSFEKSSAALKSLAAVKSPAEFFQLQSELVSSTLDAFAKETAKNSEALLKLAGDVAQPLSSRVSIVTEKVKSLAA